MRLSQVATAASTALLLAACGAEGQGLESQPIASVSDLEQEDPVDAEDVVPSTTTVDGPPNTVNDNAEYDPIKPQPPEDPLDQELDLAVILDNKIDASTAVGAYCFALQEVTRWQLGNGFIKNAATSEEETDENRQALEEMAQVAEQANLAADLAEAVDRAIGPLESAEPPSQGEEFYSLFVEEMKELSIDAERLDSSTPYEEQYQLFANLLAGIEEWPGADAFAREIEMNAEICEL